jgi:hypothetical protein
MEPTRRPDVPVVEEDMNAYDLYTAEEVFSTGPVRASKLARGADGRLVARKASGSVTKHLLAAHGELVGVDIMGRKLRCGSEYLLSIVSVIVFSHFEAVHGLLS